MRQLFSLAAITVTIALASGGETFAQDKTSEIDKIFNWATPTAPGCVCAVSQQGKVIVNRAYGSADLEREVPITTNTIFDAGSLTKQFVAAATLLLVEEKRLSLADDVRRFLPELPDYGSTIKIDHLLTHTSGLRDWTGISPLSGGTTDALTLVLRQRGLNFKPGEEWSYSNSGYVLLKEIISRLTGTPFSVFAGKRLFEPLGMKNTTYRDDLRDIVKNRALAYDKEGGSWKMSMLLDNERGGGGALLTTAEDLLKWNDALAVGRLGPFVTEKLLDPAVLNNGRKLNYSRGLFLDSYRGTREIWHTGSAAGYKSWLGRLPEQGLSIAILCNSGDGTDRTAFAHRIFDLYMPAGSATAAGPNAALTVSDTAGSIDPDSRVGLYFNEQSGEPLRLAVDGGRLRIAGGPGLIPVTKDVFRRMGTNIRYRSQDEFQVRFLSAETFELVSMDGTVTAYRRAKPYTPSAAELKAFTGRFNSDEIGTVFHVTAGKDGLAISLNGSRNKSIDFKPVDPDTFQRGMMTVHFRRDTGKIVALDFSNPMLRKVVFTRLGEQPVRQ